MLNKVKVGYSPLSERVMLYRMGKDPVAALETLDVTGQAISAVTEKLLGADGRQTVMTAKHSKLGSCRFILRLTVEPIPDLGTVIHATYRIQDLVPAFYAELFRLSPVVAVKQVTEHLHDEDEPLALFLAGMLKGEYPQDDDQVWERFEIQEVVELLQYELNAIAESFGYYFGTTEGDGSDFGFWPTEQPCATSSTPSDA